MLLLTEEKKREAQNTNEIYAKVFDEFRPLITQIVGGTFWLID